MLKRMPTTLMKISGSGISGSQDRAGWLATSVQRRQLRLNLDWTDKPAFIASTEVVADSGTQCR